MNPFDLKGPEFLLFYVIVATGVLICAAVFRRMKESRRPPKVNLEPYTIAFLRGGANETLRVALVSLVDRGLIVESSGSVRTAPIATPEAVRHPVEKALLAKFRRSGKATDIFTDGRLAELCRPYELILETDGLLPAIIGAAA